MKTTDIDLLRHELDQLLSDMEVNGLIKQVGNGYLITNAGIDQFINSQTRDADKN
jgi:F420-0:gamma-glutamyl ligase